MSSTFFFGELVCCPLFLAIQCCEVKRMDPVAVEGGFVSVNYRVVAVNSHCPVIVRDREDEYLPVKLIFMLHKFEESNNTPHR